MKKPTFQPFPVLYTERLRLRCISQEDAECLYLLRTSEENGKYLDLPIPNSKKDSQAKVKRILKGITNDESLYWIMEREEDKTVIGTICLWNFVIDKEIAELGYELLPAYKGQGYMTETLARVIDYAVKDLEFS